MQGHWKVLFELEALGAHLLFYHIVHLSQVNREWNATYRTAWPLLWRGRRDQILRNPGTWGSMKRAQLEYLSRLLLVAVKRIHVKHVQVLTEKLDANHCHLLFRRVKGMTALHTAVHLQTTTPSAEKLEIVEALLAAGGVELARIAQDSRSYKAWTAITSPLPQGSTALHICARGKCLVTTKRLLALKSEALLMHRTEDDQTCLHVGVPCGRVSVLKAIIQAGGPELLTMEDDKGFTCLHYAVVHGRLSVVEEIIRVGGRELAMLRTRTGTTAMHVAASKDHVNVLQLLFEVCGTELLMQTDGVGQTCLYIAARKGHLHAVRLLAACGGEELLLRAHVDGSTCLAASALEGHLETVDFLLAFGGARLLSATRAWEETTSFSVVAECERLGHTEVAAALAQGLDA